MPSSAKASPSTNACRCPTTSFRPTRAWRSRPSSPPAISPASARAATTLARSGGTSTSDGTSGLEFVAVAPRQAQRRRRGARALRHGASLGGRRSLALLRPRREPPRGGCRLRGRRHARGLSRSEYSLSQPLAPFLRRRHRPLGRARGAQRRRCPRARAHGRRPRNRERAARCRRRRSLALPRTRERSLVRALRRPCRRELRHVSRGSVLGRPRSTMAGRRRRARNHRRGDAGGPFSGRFQKSSGRIGKAQRAAAPARASARRSHGSVRPRGSASRQPGRLLAQPRPRPPPRGVAALGHAAGCPVGDAGRHPAVRTGDATDGIVPFHKLSQWLAYSLIEPLEAAGLAVERLHELTALAEYRNGGLLIDLGAICPRAAIDPALRHDVGSELIIEWRALTVALMEPLVGLVREKLGLDSSFAMPQLLQGGTWSAGRKIAHALRPPNGPPPIAVEADGAVF